MIFEIALATVGVTEIVKNFFSKGGKKLWSLITLIVGACVSCVAVFCPENVLHSIVGVSGAVVFYDTIFKYFKKLFSKMDIKGE
jgi:uncharacterized membrane protein HdeD (DUF308 family)